MPAITIDPNFTYTKAEFSRAFNIPRVRLDKEIAEKKHKTIQVKGTTLVLSERG